MDFFSQLLSNRMFEDSLCAPAAPAEYSDCEYCLIPMDLKGNEYICPTCGFVRAGADQLDGQGEVGASSVTLVSASGKLQTFNNSGSVERVRADAIEVYLLQKQRDYAARNGDSLAFPSAIITAVATRYAEIQQQHNTGGHGVFIHRGGVRNKILAALLRDECNIARYPRKPEVIADFMQLNSNGFSEGESILQSLVTKGITTLAEPCGAEQHAQRYCGLLGIASPDNIQFVTDIVVQSEEINLGMNSHHSSKIAGALRLLVVSIGRTDITTDAIEAVTDNTKTNTYMKFYNLVVDNLSKFVYVYRRSGIPYPADLQIIKRNAGRKPRGKRIGK